MGSDPQERFAQRDEGPDVEDPLWRQVMKSEAVEEHKAPQGGCNGRPSPKQWKDVEEMISPSPSTGASSPMPGGHQPTTRTSFGANPFSSIILISASVTPDGPHSAMGMKAGARGCERMHRSGRK